MTRPGHDDAYERTRGFEGPTPGTVGDQLERTIGGYRIVRGIGRGAMGVVYEAEEDELGRHVALKVLPELFSHEPERLDARPEDVTERLHHEIAIRSADELELVVVTPGEDGPYRSCEVVLTRR